MTTPRLVVASACTLGEAPLWDPGRGVLWWVDIQERALWRFDPRDGAATRQALPVQATALGLCADGRFVMAAREGVGLFDPDQGAFTLRAQPEPDRPHNRTNDGHVGADGAFWFGTMHESGAKETGALYRLASDWTAARLRDGWGIANTMLTDAAGATLFAADSAKGQMIAFEIEDGRLGPARVLFEAGAEGWTPDGSALDAEGCLWNARWGGWAVARISPNGETLQEIALPVEQPTSCAFGGADLRTLYVTSAREGLDDAALARRPEAGGVFAIDVDVAGAPAPAFGGTGR